jgi:hypothetical protein
VALLPANENIKLRQQRISLNNKTFTSMSEGEPLRFAASSISFLLFAASCAAMSASKFLDVFCAVCNIRDLSSTFSLSLSRLLSGAPELEEESEVSLPPPTLPSPFHPFPICHQNQNQPSFSSRVPPLLYQQLCEH